jgi:hypothetical protein
MPARAVVPQTLLRYQHDLVEGMKTFVQATQQYHPELREYLDHMERLGALVETMTFSAPSTVRSTTLHSSGALARFEANSR